MMSARQRRRKATFNLSDEVLGALDRAVGAGAAPSKNAFVEQALIHELDESRRADRRTRWQEASRDPAFLRDLEDVEAAFRVVDAEITSRPRRKHTPISLSKSSAP